MKNRIKIHITLGTFSTDIHKQLTRLLPLFGCHTNVFRNSDIINRVTVSEGLFERLLEIFLDHIDWFQYTDSGSYTGKSDLILYKHNEKKYHIERKWCYGTKGISEIIRKDYKK